MYCGSLACQCILIIAERIFEKYGVKIMEDKQVERLCAKLDLILKIIAIDKLSGKKQVQQVAMLTDFGFRPSEIAVVLGRKPKEITSVLSKMKKRTSTSPSRRS